MGEQVRVVVRVRPLNVVGSPSRKGRRINARAEMEQPVVAVDTPDRVGYQVSPSERQVFRCDCALGPEDGQEEVFARSGVTQLLDRAMEGYRCTVFAYGQTGAGKTHTMIGAESGTAEQRQGLLSRAVDYLFRRFHDLQDTHSFKVKVSCLEIYMEAVTDLLVPGGPGRRPLHVREHADYGFFVEGLRILPCSDRASVLRAAGAVLGSRKVGSHQLNSRSNRSHLMFTLYVDSKVRQAGSGPTTYGSITFVDLAGSERLKETGSTGETLREAGHINKSLYVLGKVIRAINARQHPVPYRDSKLTKLLYASLGGNCKTMMVACVSPSAASAHETVRTLKFTIGVKGISNHPTVLLNPQDLIIKGLQEEVVRLRKENAQLRETLVRSRPGSTVSLHSLHSASSAGSSGSSYGRRQHPRSYFPATNSRRDIAAAYGLGSAASVASAGSRSARSRASRKQQSRSRRVEEGAEEEGSVGGDMDASHASISSMSSSNESHEASGVGKDRAVDHGQPRSAAARSRATSTDSLPGRRRASSSQASRGSQRAGQDRKASVASSLVAAGAGTISSSRVRQPWVGGSPVRPGSRRTGSGGKKRLLSQRELEQALCERLAMITALYDQPQPPPASSASSTASRQAPTARPAVAAARKRAGSLNSSTSASATPAAGAPRGQVATQKRPVAAKQASRGGANSRRQDREEAAAPPQKAPVEEQQGVVKRVEDDHDSPRVVAVEEHKSKASTPPDQGSQEPQLMTIPATSSFKTSVPPQERPAVVAPPPAVAPTRPPPPQVDEEEYEDDAEAFEAEEGGEDDKKAPVQQPASNKEQEVVGKPATAAVKADDSVAVKEKQQSNGSKKEEEEERRGSGGAVSRKEPAAEKAKEEDEEGYGEEEYEMDEGGEEEKAKDHKQEVTNSSLMPAPGARSASRQEEGEERAAASKVEPQGPTPVERAGSGAKLQTPVQAAEPAGRDDEEEEYGADEDENFEKDDDEEQQQHKASAAEAPKSNQPPATTASTEATKLPTEPAQAPPPASGKEEADEEYEDDHEEDYEDDAEPDDGDDKKKPPQPQQPSMVEPAAGAAVERRLSNIVMSVSTPAVASRGSKLVTAKKALQQFEGVELTYAQEQALSLSTLLPAWQVDLTLRPPAPQDQGNQGESAAAAVKGAVHAPAGKHTAGMTPRAAKSVGGVGAQGALVSPAPLSPSRSEAGSSSVSSRRRRRGRGRQEMDPERRAELERYLALQEDVLRRAATAKPLTAAAAADTRCQPAGIHQHVDGIEALRVAHEQAAAGRGRRQLTPADAVAQEAARAQGERLVRARRKDSWDRESMRHLVGIWEQQHRIARAKIAQHHQDQDFIF